MTRAQASRVLLVTLTDQKIRATEKRARQYDVRMPKPGNAAQLVTIRTFDSLGAAVRFAEGCVEYDVYPPVRPMVVEVLA